ncbi:HNH endonuclease signature motif containing protein [Streptomyces sp. NPDC057302]|uniref:HNH endonuclease signature motif containing protein n=1 Tax=Streptomyces sp. NPDC057302 TaxID=3346094 RepID=UPI003628D823
MSQVKYPRMTLARMAPTCTSLVDLMRRLGMPMGSGPRRYLRDRLRHYGIDTRHFREEPLPERSPRSYAKETLADAAAHSSSIREMFLHMGIPPEDGPYGHIKKKLDQFGIDTSHFTWRHGEAADSLFPRADLARAVAESHGLAEVMRALGCSPFGGAGRARAVRSIEAYGLSTAHFVGQGHNAGRSGANRKSADAILIRLGSDAGRTRTIMLRRALDEVGAPRVCGACGLGETWQDKRLTLEIDHINGDRLDNRRENLRYLCPSCHSQTGTFSNRRRAAQ